MPKTFSTTSKPTTNANLTGVITSVGNATSIASQTGTGTKFVVDTTPTLVTPVIGVATGTSLDLGATTLYASRAITVDTGGVLNIDIGSAAGDDFTVDTNKLVVEGDSGNVGIGTTAPGAKLEVNGGVAVGTSYGIGDVPQLNIYGTTGGPNKMIGFHQQGSANWGITLGSETIANLYMGRMDAQQMRDYFWRANWNTAEVAANTFQTPDTTNSGGSALGMTTLNAQGISGQTGDLLTVTGYGQTLGNLFKVQANGNVGIGTTGPNYKLEVSTDSAGKPGTGGLWTVVSDERLKDNIVPADLNRCYEIVKTIPLKRFTWKDSVYTTDQVRDRSGLGWVANDVLPIFPKSVDKHDFTLPKPKDAPDDYKEEVIKDCLDLNSGQIIAALFGAVQKLIEKVEKLETTNV